MIEVPVSAGVDALNGGLFISSGYGTHPVRVLDSYEIIFVTSGKLDLFEGEHSFHLVRNQALILRPGVRHGGLKPYVPDLRFYWAHFRLHRSFDSGRAVSVPKLTRVRDPEELTELFCRFLSDQESDRRDPLTASLLVGLIISILAEPADSMRPPQRAREPRATHARIAAKIQAFIAAHFREAISTSAIADTLHYNADYLERIFRRETGMSVVDAIHQKRIAAARLALRNDAAKNINEIAYECGYEHPTYFHRMFKRLSGFTPREFRNLYSRTHINTH